MVLDGQAVSKCRGGHSKESGSPRGSRLRKNGSKRRSIFNKAALPRKTRQPAATAPEVKGKEMYAIVETGGKQYKLEEGRYTDIELLEGNADEKVVFDKVVMLVNGKKSKVGQPYVEKASVEGVIVKHDKAKKVIVYKQRAKKGYRKKQGHRQAFTRVMINKIRTTASRAKAAAETETTEE